MARIKGEEAAHWIPGSSIAKRKCCGPTAARPCIARKCSTALAASTKIFFAYGDDAELGLRARIAGWKCIYTPEAVVRHHRGSTLGKDSTRRLELIERNRLLLAWKLFPWSLLWLNPFYFAARVAAGFAAAGRGEGDTAHFPGLRGKWKMAAALIKGDWEALKLLPRMLRNGQQYAVSAVSLRAKCGG